MKTWSTSLAVLATMFASLAGCESGESRPGPSPVPSGFTPDEATPAGPPAVYLQGRRVEGERVVVDVIARGAPDVHGAAFRLRWDPAKLTFVQARGSDAWSRQALLLAKEGAPGELAVAWTEKGSGSAIDARADTRLGSIDFLVKTLDGAALAFRADRSMLLDAKGSPVAVAWRGGQVGPR